MDAIAMLKTQHDDLEDLFHDLGVARGMETRTAIFEELASALIAHTALEERLLRRALASAPREARMLEAWESRLRVERVITELAAMNPADAAFDAQLARLQDLVETRVEHEETHVLPKLERFLPPHNVREPELTMGGLS